MLLESDVRIVQRRHRFFRFEQQRNYMVGILRIESSRSSGQTLADWRATGDAVPGKVDAVENVFRRHRAGLRYQKILGRSSAFRRAHALAAMHAAGHAGDLSIGVAQHWI